MRFIGAVRMTDGSKHIIDVHDTLEYPISSYEEAYTALLSYETKTSTTRSALVLVADNSYQEPQTA